MCLFLVLTKAEVSLSSICRFGCECLSLYASSQGFNLIAASIRIGTDTECLLLAVVLNASGVEHSIELEIETADSESDRHILTGFGWIRLYLDVGFRGELEIEETVVVAVVSLVIEGCGDASLTAVVGTSIMLVDIAGCVIRDGVPVRGIAT